MADDKTLRGPHDASRIALGEDYEVTYWTKRFGITEDQLRKATKAVSTSADAVERHLKES